MQNNTSIRLPPGIDSRNLLTLKLPVEIPPVPIVVTAQLEISSLQTGPGEVQFAAVDQALLAEVTLRYSQGWDNESTGPTIDDEFEITYEIQASPEVWLVGGQRKAYVTAKARISFLQSVINRIRTNNNIGRRPHQLVNYSDTPKNRLFAVPVTRG